MYIHVPPVGTSGPEAPVGRLSQSPAGTSGPEAPVGRLSRSPAGTSCPEAPVGRLSRSPAGTSCPEAPVGRLSRSPAGTNGHEAPIGCLSRSPAGVSGSPVGGFSVLHTPPCAKNSSEWQEILGVSLCTLYKCKGHFNPAWLISVASVQKYPCDAGNNERQPSAQGISVYVCTVLLLVGWSINFYTTRGRLPSC